MKNRLLFLLIATFIASNSFGQVSIGTGLVIPVSSLGNTNYGSANLGYQFQANLDKFVSEYYGISSGILIGTNPINENTSSYTDGSWSYLVLELGLILAPAKNIRLKSLVTAGSYGTPNIAFEDLTTGTGGTFSGSKIGLGIDFRIEYVLNNWFIGTNIFYSKPNLKFETFSINASDFKSIANLGLTIGYIL